MFGRNLLLPGSLWRHVATGGQYVVLGIARCATNGPQEGEEVAVYWSTGRHMLNYRALAEFLDGRFVLLDGAGQPMPFGPRQETHDVR